MSRQYNEALDSLFDIYGTEHRLIQPENTEELVTALEVKAALTSYISGLMHDEDSSIYTRLLQEQENYIKEYLDSLGEFDNSHLIENINYFLRKHNLRIGELEQLIGVSAGYISRTAKENATKKLSIDTVWKLAMLFEVDIRTLIESNLMVPNNNEEIISKFLDKLCSQTEQHVIKWENRGGAMCYLDESLLDIDLFTAEEDGTIVYKANDHMNPNLKFVLADDIYTCNTIVEGKEFAMIGFSIDGKEESYFLDFVFLSKIKQGDKSKYVWEKGFYSSDDRFRRIETKAERLMHLVQAQEMDAEIPPSVRNIIINYLK